MILILEKQQEYELLDSGENEKLERFGSYVMSRPDKEAMWPKTLDKKEWDKSSFSFSRDGKKTKWFVKKGSPSEWQIKINELTFLIKPTSFKHTGIFPEQALNWSWMEDLIKKEKREVNILNLFAYTGGATLSCAKAGANVCHVDASKQAVSWARENARMSGLEDKNIRWIIDDVNAFLKREIKRGRKYDGIVMDPPSFGHGPKDELWKIEKDFLELMNLTKELLSDDPIFFLINGYTAGYSSFVYENNLKKIFRNRGKIESGELLIKQTQGDILLPCGIFSRWKKD